MGVKKNKPLSILTRPHPLHRELGEREAAGQALQILRDSFVRVPLPTDKGQSGDFRHGLVEHCKKGTVIVPRRQSDLLPFHLFTTGHPQPWSLMPMRAAAFQQYPNLFNHACSFFNGLEQAVVTKRAVRKFPCTAATLGLAKLVRNLGIVSSLEVFSVTGALGPSQLVWPRGEEPQYPEDIGAYRHLKINVGIRWEAYRALYQLPSTSVLQESVRLTQGMPFKVYHISRPSVPLITSPRELREAVARLPPGVTVMYHDQLGLTTDFVTSHYGVAAMPLSHLVLPWVQVAQIQAGLREKLAREKDLPMSSTVPLTEWNLTEWVARSVDKRLQQVQSLTTETDKELSDIVRQASTRNDQDKRLARESAYAASQLQDELMAPDLLVKLEQAIELAAKQETRQAQQQRAQEPPPGPSNSGASGTGAQGAGSGTARQQRTGPRPAPPARPASTAPSQSQLQPSQQQGAAQPQPFQQGPAKPGQAPSSAAPGAGPAGRRTGPLAPSGAPAGQTGGTGAPGKPSGLTQTQGQRRAGAPGQRLGPSVPRQFRKKDEDKQH